MAEKRQQGGNKYEEIMTALKNKKYSSVYLLTGEESYYIDKVCDYITSNVLKEEEKDFNLTLLYGSDVTAQQVMDMSRRYPMMADRQIVVVREAQAMRDIDALEKYMANPVATTILVICYMGKIDGRKKFPALVMQKGTMLISESPKYDSAIISFMESYLREPEHKATIDTRAAQIVAAHIGGDLKRLTSELDKVLLSFAPGDPRQITVEIVEQKIGISKNYNVFELRDAIIHKDVVKAHRIAKYFDDNPKAGGLFAVIPQLFAFFQNLMLAYYTPRPATDDAIMAQLGLKSKWAVRDYVVAMKAFPARKTIQIISKIREVDARSKGLDNVSTTPGELLKELISFILS